MCCHAAKRNDGRFGVLGELFQTPSSQRPRARMRPGGEDRGNEQQVDAACFCHAHFAPVVHRHRVQQESGCGMFVSPMNTVRPPGRCVLNAPSQHNHQPPCPRNASGRVKQCAAFCCGRRIMAEDQPRPLGHPRKSGQKAIAHALVAHHPECRQGLAFVHGLAYSSRHVGTGSKSPP